MFSVLCCVLSVLCVVLHSVLSVLCVVLCLEYALCLYCVLSVLCVVVFSYEVWHFFFRACCVPCVTIGVLCFVF